jgi:hypothetical protein
MDERKCGVPMDDSEREEVSQAGRQGHYQRRERGRWSAGSWSEVEQEKTNYWQEERIQWRGI